MRFPQLEIGQIGYFNGQKIKRVGQNVYSTNGVKYTKGELIGSAIVSKYKL